MNNENSKVKNCLICGTSFTPERSTKKYCSDNCKQNAFYQRNSASGITFNDKSEILTRVILSQPDQHVEREISLNANPLFEDKHDMRDYKEITRALPDKDKYESVRSPFIEAVADAIEHSCHIELMFNNSFSPWSGRPFEAVKKTNTYLLCLLENMLHLSRQSRIRRKTFVVIRDAFKSMSASADFNKLPRDYPYIGFIKEIENICTHTAARYKNRTQFRLRLSPEKKIEFITVRFILSGSTSFVSFHDLDFDDKATLNANSRSHLQRADQRRRYR